LKNQEQFFRHKQPFIHISYRANKPTKNSLRKVV